MTGWVARTIVNRDGLNIALRIYGAATDRPPVVCLAGLTRNGRDFHRFALRLSTDPDHPRQVITIDTRGRGASDRDPDPARYTVPHEAGDVLDVLSALGIAKADMIGTSRGGLILHVLAATTPRLIAKAVLNDIGPVIATEGLRKIQSYLAHEARPTSRAEAIDTLRHLHGADFPALDAEDWDDLATALYRETDGEWVADVDPAIPAAMGALDLTQPLPDLWQAFEAFAGHPLMVVRGEHSSLLTEEILTAMAERHAGLVIHRAEGEGHAPLLHRDSSFTAIRRFLHAVD